MDISTFWKISFITQVFPTQKLLEITWNIPKWQVFANLNRTKFGMFTVDFNYENSEYIELQKGYDRT